MISAQITIAYHSVKMWNTLDLQFLFADLFEHMGPCTVVLRPMDAEELQDAETPTDLQIMAVTARFMIYRHHGDGHTTRERWLEDDIVQRGQK